MLIEQTLDKLNAMKLGGMADALQRQLQTDEAAVLSFEERLGQLVDTEWTTREQRKLERRLHAAKLRYPATLEAVDFTHPRRLNRQQILTLGTCAWITERHNLIVTGACGIGKSFLACAFVERACRRGFAARYVRMPRLLHELAVGRGDGSSDGPRRLRAGRTPRRRRHPDVGPTGHLRRPDLRQGHRHADPVDGDAAGSLTVRKPPGRGHSKTGLHRS